VKGLLGPLLELIAFGFALLVAVALLSLFWPLACLAGGYAIFHSSRALGYEWQQWEWGLVVLAVLLQLGVFVKARVG